MNEPQYFEAGRHLAQLAMKSGAKTPQEIATYIFRRAALRSPTPEDMEDLLDTYRESLAEYRADPKAAKETTMVGGSKPDPSLDVVELASWSMVGNLILNLDEIINKN
jgi:hypothetical protein